MEASQQCCCSAGILGFNEKNIYVSFSFLKIFDPSPWAGFDLATHWLNIFSTAGDEFKGNQSRIN
jgi:hypothetical protein